MADNDWAELHKLRLEAMKRDTTLIHAKGDPSSYVDADLIYQDLSPGGPTQAVADHLRALGGKEHLSADWLGPNRSDPGADAHADADAYLSHMETDLHLKIWDFRDAPRNGSNRDVREVAKTVRKKYPEGTITVQHIPAYNKTPLSFGPFGPPVLLPSGQSVLSPSGPDESAASVRLAILDTGIPGNYAALHPRLNKAVAPHPDDEDPYTGTKLRLDAGHGLFILDVVHHLAPSVTPAYMRRPARTDSNLSLVDHLVARDVWDVVREAAEWGLIVNMSFAAHTTDDRPGLGLFRELDWLVEKGYNVLVVAAAGNNGDHRKTFPAACDLPNVVSVGALDASGHVAPFSSRGSWVDCWTTGVGIEAGYLSGTYDHPLGYEATFPDQEPSASWSGTSFAAPRVAAAIARKAATMPNSRLLEVWEALRKENRDRHPHWSDSSDRFYTEHGVIINI